MLAPLSEALAERGYDTLTPVQAAVSDPDLASRDLLVSAQTGSGKTVGFGLAIAPTLLGEDDHFGPAAAPLALVIAPTRELALQVMRELGWLYAKAGARMASCIGGMDQRDERRALDRGAHIVVGTPGRLRDHIQRGNLDMTDLKAVVLDEADEMLDMGFREDLEFMLDAAPASRRTLLFSATVPPMIAKLAEQFQTDAHRVNTLSSGDQHSDISYHAVRVAQNDSENAIFNLLRFHDAESAIVFANTRAAVNHLTARLTNRGLAVVSLSGELSQSERTHALQAMRDGRARICVATDVAARGIDLPNLNLVIHADLPKNTESLLHRSGRTGRAGRKGISALIVPPRDVKRTERVLKWAKISAEWVLPPSAEDILKQDEDRLLTDPDWDTPIPEDQAAFAARLLAERSPEAVAAAYLRLFRSRNGAPEELGNPDERPARKERAPFGPSRWISLSVGRSDRAEARWLLPLLCRAGNIDKSAIGAIRVQDSETFVELTEASSAGFFSAIGPDGALEDGIKASAVEGTPAFADRGPKPAYKGGDRGGDRGGDKPAYKGKSGDKPAYKGKSDKPAYKGKSGDKPAYKAKSDKPAYKGNPDKPVYDPDRPVRDLGAKPKGKPKPKAAGSWDDKPKGKPAGKSAGKPAGKWDDKPKGKPGGKPAGKFAKPGGKPTGKPGGKPGGKPTGKPTGKPASGGDARDASKRFTPPGYAKAGGKAGGKAGAKPGGKKPGGKPARGGADVPRRPKS